MAIQFRPTEDDTRIIERFGREGESASDVLRRGLRSLDRLAWEEAARADMAKLAGEDLSDEPDAWVYGEDGGIRIVGTEIVVRASDANDR